MSDLTKIRKLEKRSKTNIFEASHELHLIKRELIKKFKDRLTDLKVIIEAIKK